MDGAELVLQSREKRRVAMSSVLAAIFLTAIKLVIGFATGSLGILAEAAHSCLDLAAAIITWIAVRLSDRPADDSHPYGHGKFENLSALVETLLLLVTCVWIVYEAIQRLFFVEIEVDPSVWAFAAMAVSIVTDFSRSRALARIAKKYNSQALEADALHFSTDIWSSLVVILGLALVRFGEYAGMKSIFVRADAIAALVVALIVILVSARLGSRTLGALLDRAPEGLSEEYEKALAGIEGILRISRMRVRNVGSQIFVDLNVDVPSRLSFEESHDVTQRVQDAVRCISPRADVVVHADPVAENAGVFEKIETIAAHFHAPIHNIMSHRTERGIWIDLDVEIDPELSFEKAHALATDLENQLRDELGRDPLPAAIADVHVHIEPRREMIAEGMELEAAKAEVYRARISSICRGIHKACGCQDIELHVLEGEIYTSLHLLVDLSCAVAEVHAVMEELEARMRNEIPELGRIVIHAEPAR